MAISKEQAIEILEFFDFFQGQRAGRELWAEKPYEVQEEDIAYFSERVSLLKEYIAEVAPKSEVIEEYRKKVYSKMEKYTVFGREYIQRIMREAEKEMKDGAE